MRKEIGSTVYGATLAYMKNCQDPVPVIDLVDDPIGTDSNPPAFTA